MASLKKSTFEEISSQLNDEFKDHITLCDFNSEVIKKNVVYISEGVASADILNKFKNQRNFHLIQEDSINITSELNLSAQMIMNPQSFIESPMEFVLSPSGTKSDTDKVIYECDFSRQEEKYEILNEVEAAVVKNTQSQSLIYDIQSIADELVTNAIFHSKSAGKRSNEMHGNKSGNIQIGINENYLIISCSDPYGKLIPEKLFERLYTCYTSDVAESINQGEGGAGLGLFLVHGMSTGYIVAVEEGVKTVITALLPLKMSNRKKLGLSKNMHSLFIKGSTNE